MINFLLSPDIEKVVWYCVSESVTVCMAQKKLLTNGNVFKRTDKRWGGVVWYSDEQGERRRKSFSSTTKQEVNRKITDYIAAFNESKIASQEPKRRLRNSMQGWLVLFKFPSVEQTTYDHCECTARNQIYPMLGDKTVGDITAADIKALLNHFMNEDYAYTTVNKIHNLLGEYKQHFCSKRLCG